MRAAPEPTTSQEIPVPTTTEVILVPTTHEQNERPLNELRPGFYADLYNLPADDEKRSPQQKRQIKDNENRGMRVGMVSVEIGHHLIIGCVAPNLRHMPHDSNHNKQCSKKWYKDGFTTYPAKKETEFTEDNLKLISETNATCETNETCYEATMVATYYNTMVAARTNGATHCIFPLLGSGYLMLKRFHVAHI